MRHAAAVLSLLLAGCAHRLALAEPIRVGAGSIHLRVGETCPAIRRELGVATVGGWVPALASESPSVVEVRERPDGEVDLVALRPGRARVRILNALARPHPGEPVPADAAGVEVVVAG